MGHLCNIPDISWRNIGEKGKIDASSHYIEPDLFGSTLKEISSDFKKIEEQFIGKKNIKGERSFHSSGLQR